MYSGLKRAPLSIVGLMAPSPASVWWQTAPALAAMAGIAAALLGHRLSTQYIDMPAAESEELVRSALVQVSWQSGQLPWLHPDGSFC